MTDRLVTAVADGHDVWQHECLLNYVRDGQTVFRVSYRTTQHDSSSGIEPRTIIITGLQDEGQAQDTDKGMEEELDHDQVHVH